MWTRRTDVRGWLASIMGMAPLVKRKAIEQSDEQQLVRRATEKGMVTAAAFRAWTSSICPLDVYPGPRPAGPRPWTGRSCVQTCRRQLAVYEAACYLCKQVDCPEITRINVP